jgi:hypothetical protein
MVKYLRTVTLLAALCGAFLSCAKDTTPATELMLVADTDIADLDTIRFEVNEGDRTESEEAAPRDDGEPLTLGVVRDKGSLGPLKVLALGIRAGRTIVERSAVVSFAPEKTLVVELHLLRSCENKRCLSNQTCGERGCMSNELAEDDLNEWSGTPPMLPGTLLGDAGASSSEGGVDSGEADGGGELVTCGLDQRVDLSSDVDHCGDCATACKTNSRNMVAACVAGACTEECRVLYGDCDGNLNNGCEQSLSSSTHCGACGMACAAGGACVLGACR